MKKICIQFFSLLVLLGALSGCATQRLTFGNFERDIPDYTEKRHFMFWGIGSGQGDDTALNVSKICNNDPNKVVRIERVIEPMDIFLTLVTLGIYMPQTDKVYCRR